MGINYFFKNVYIFVATSQSSSKAVSSLIGRHLMETESSNIFFGVLNNNIYEKKRIGLNFIDENNYFKAFLPHHQKKKN